MDFRSIMSLFREDDWTGNLVEKLDEWDAWDNTLVIFMTDNGQAGARDATLNGEETKLYTPFKTDSYLF